MTISSLLWCYAPSLYSSTTLSKVGTLSTVACTFCILAIVSDTFYQSWSTVVCCVRRIGLLDYLDMPSTENLQF